MNLLSNPEFLRYARIQLRPNKIVIAVITCAVISITTVLVVTQSLNDYPHRSVTGNQLLGLLFSLQAFLLAVGGGVACLNSIYSEKDHNTFDYQRITRLTSLELALGKLFGAPLLMYFICLCFVPLTFYAAVLAGARPSLVLAAYVVLFVSSLAFHSLTLLLSVLIVKGSQVTGILVCLLLFGIYSTDPRGNILTIGSLGPFAAGTFATAESWRTDNTYVSLFDHFFGFRLHHFPVLIFIDLFCAFWFLLAVVRNIKRDPQRYQVYSPTQSILFALTLNFLLIGFFARWTSVLDSQSFFLTMNLILFGLLGLALLHNRDSARGSLLAAHHQPLLLEALWPAPILLAGTLLANVLIIAQLIRLYPSSTGPSAPGSFLPFVLLRSLAFILWITTNFQFLQCMNLRRGKHPLVLGVLYLTVYYVCVLFVLASIGCFRVPQNMSVGSLFVPSAIYLLDRPNWIYNPSLWVAGFIIQVLLLFVLAFFQSRQLARLKSELAAVSTPT
ncbi:MAG TPA: hypothetical protein VMH31_05845 [Methylomirabilota bacterium]|nr:hypothetical protein [Methylomirabilota bacterium]